MKVIVVGATGMVGQGVLRECLPDLTDLSAIEGDLSGHDACFFCLGVTSAGLKEDAYRRVTYDITAAFAGVLSRLNPGMTFVFVSGRGTDSTERGSIMWARVKGAAENVVRNSPFKASYMFRPGIIQPLHGIKSRTPGYRVLYVLLWPAVMLLKVFSPTSITTTERVGRAMLEVARHGAPKPLLENADINDLAARTTSAR